MGANVRYNISYRGSIDYHHDDIDHVDSDIDNLTGEVLMEIVENSKELKEPTKAVLLQLIKRSFDLEY
jgi:hypothetical protein